MWGYAMTELLQEPVMARRAISAEDRPGRVARISQDLSAILTELAKEEGISVMQLVELSPLRGWALERHARLMHSKPEAAQKALADLRKRQKSN